MKKRITSISLLQAAKVVAIMYLVISVPIAFFMWVIFLLSPGSRPAMTGMVLLTPIFYMVFGFVFALIGAWIYNNVAKWVGGFEFTTSESDDS